jgi:HK97 gp10 family phage protein
MPSIKITGVKELQKQLKKNVTLDDVKKAVRKNGTELQTKMQDKADFTKGYQTGATKDSIRVEMSNSNLTATVEPTTEYSPYLEFGTRFMDAQPFVRPAFEEQLTQFKSDMQKLVK